MATYQVSERRKSRRRRRIFFSLAALVFIGLIIWAVGFVRAQLKPQTTIKQASAKVTKVSYDQKTRHYDEPDFSVDLLSTWQPVQSPPGPYQSFIWQSSDRGAGGQVIEIFEDTIPTKFAVNRVLVVEGESDHLRINGSISDNCAEYTGVNTAAPGPTGVPAKWQGISFLCDQNNTQRDVIGTSSKDGINTVVLRTGQGVSHKFLFTYTDYAINPDYTVFSNFLQSFKMQ